ncbi:MAG TPA: hypothetical protein VHB47_18485 [Thermoanaerobaculia bacterium]|jgi:hypothetical protein|nr:hypothetical protein [Thermoanaerobaculia bacterium]
MKFGSFVASGVKEVNELFPHGPLAPALFRSDFNSSTAGEPPLAAQQTGTVTVGGNVDIGYPLGEGSNWVRLERATFDPNPNSLPTLNCQFSQSPGEGVYKFSAALFISSAVGSEAIEANPVATISFEDSIFSNLDGFLHLDFTADNHVRIDDDDSTDLTLTFPRDKVFSVQAILNINAASPSVRIELSGNGASGEACRDVSQFGLHLLRDSGFGGVTFWIGAESLGMFYTANVLVTRETAGLLAQEVLQEALHEVARPARAMTDPGQP